MNKRATNQQNFNEIVDSAVREDLSHRPGYYLSNNIMNSIFSIYKDSQSSMLSIGASAYYKMLCVGSVAASIAIGYWVGSLYTSYSSIQSVSVNFDNVILTSLSLI